jgi:acyl carrier protein
MRDKIIEVLANILEQDKSFFSDDVVIREIPGFDSLQFVMMISELQESYGIEIPLDRALEIRTIGELIDSARTIE